MKAAASLPEHPCFPHIVGRLHVEQGTKLASGRAHRRIELDCSGLVERQIEMLRSVRVRCAACGSTICPFRSRVGGRAGRASRPTRMFVSVACPLDVTFSCARGAAASSATARLAEAIEAHRRMPPAPPRAESNEPTQLGLKGVFS
jgi:hypothetical protein